LNSTTTIIPCIGDPPGLPQLLHGEEHVEHDVSCGGGCDDNNDNNNNNNKTIIKKKKKQ
jgi:hypothetical protein